MNRMYDMIENQSKAREETHNAYTSLVDNLDQKVRQELLREKKERESTEETLIKLLEDTCRRVELALNGDSFYQLILFFENFKRASYIFQQCFLISYESTKEFLNFKYYC